MHITFDEIKKKYKNQIPVPVVSIANDLGLQIYESNDFENSQSGSIQKENDKYIIYINAKHPLTRKRFTIAHEIGHFINDQDYLNSYKECITDFKQPLSTKLNRTDSTQNDDLKRRDQRANQFAAELLMPEDVFREKYNQAQNIEEIAVYFNVSTGAASIRASQLFNTVFI